jgi:hypothetical protein
VIERGHGARFHLKALAAGRIAGYIGRKNLQGDVAMEARVAGPVDFTHTAGAQWREDSVRAELLAGQDRFGDALLSGFQKISSLGSVSQERLNFMPQIGILATLAIQVCLARGRFNRERPEEKFLDLPEAFGIHLDRHVSERF